MPERRSYDETSFLYYREPHLRAEHTSRIDLLLDNTMPIIHVKCMDFVWQRTVIDSDIYLVRAFLKHISLRKNRFDSSSTITVVLIYSGVTLCSCSGSGTLLPWILDLVTC